MTMHEIKGIKTNHMRMRQQQRGISDGLIDLMVLFGRTSYNQGGWVTDLSSNGVSEMQDRFPELDPGLVEKLARSYLVEAGGIEVTVGYKRKGWGKRFSSGKRRKRVSKDVWH